MSFLFNIFRSLEENKVPIKEELIRNREEVVVRVKEEGVIKDREILFKIFLFLTPLEIETLVKRTSHLWYSIITDKLLWENYLVEINQKDNIFYSFFSNMKEYNPEYGKKLYLQNSYRNYMRGLIKNGTIKIKRFTENELSKIFLSKEKTM
jgi:hypothetical protein